MRKGTALVALLVVIAACSTPSSVNPLSVPLHYKPMLNPAEYATLPACAALSKVDVSDARSEQAIGKRFVEGKTSPSAPVTASTDVAAWVRTGVENALNHSNVSTSKADAPELFIRVEQIVTSENVLHRSGYEGRITLSAELRPHHGSTPCWKERAEGSAENYGYAGSIENYQETLNHALDRAVARLLNSPELRKICSCGGA